MPRKQRFKPSRKPKPIPPNEDALTGRQPSSVRPTSDNADARESPQERDDDSIVEPDLDHRSS